MTDQLDLIDYIDNTARLFKKPGTSSKAAAGAAKKAPSKKEIILAELANGPATPDQIWRRHGGVLNTWRARCSDLQNPCDKAGNRLPPLITPTGLKGLAEGGRPADVLRLTTEQERKEWRDGRVD